MPDSSDTRGSHEPETPATYRGSLSLLATFVMCLTFLWVVSLERPAVETALHELAAGPGQLSHSNIAVLAQVAGVPILSAIVAYIIAARAIQLVRINLYRGSLHRAMGDWLRTSAPLREAGIRLTGTAYDSSGRPAGGQDRFLDSAPEGGRSLLVLGVEGAGKTVLARTLAFELTRKRALVPLYMRRAALPILVECAALSDAALFNQSAFIQILRHQMRVFGTKGIVARLPRMLRRGRILLVCDGLDELDASDRTRICKLVADMVTTYQGHTAAILTCDLHTYESERRSMSPLKALDRVLINEVKTDDAIEALRKRPAAGGPRHLPTSDLRRALESHNLTNCIHNPAVFAALLAIHQEPDAWPFGRGELLRAYARAMCAVESSDSAHIDRSALLLGALAVSLRVAGSRTIRIPRARSIGRVVVDMLEAAPPLTPTELQVESLLIASPEEAETICQSAVKQGILMYSTDGTSISFANSVLEAAFAACWLDMMDDGLGRVNAELLHSRWTLPVVLWAGAQTNPADLAARLYRLADSPESTATRAGLATREAVQPATLALALAALCEGLAGMLAREAVSPAGSQHAIDVPQQHLRDRLDELQRLAQSPEEDDRLVQALAQVERQTGPDFVHGIAYLARMPRLSRLVRAQLTVLLGLIASPVAVASIVELLDEPDPVMRQAVNAAVILAGAACLEPLQAALRSRSDRVRARAEEALALLGDDATDAAIRSLGSTNPEQRASAARTLGRLSAERACDALILRLDDGESVVRVAAARALGQIASGQALVALEQHVSSADVALRVALAEALEQGHDIGSLQALLQLLNDADAVVRTAAANALGVLGDERAVVPLQEHRDDADPWAQRAVVLALRRMGRTTG